MPEATRLGVEVREGRMASCFSKPSRCSLFNSLDLAFGQDDLNLALAAGPSLATKSRPQHQQKNELRESCVRAIALPAPRRGRSLLNAAP